MYYSEVQGIDNFKILWSTQNPRPVTAVVMVHDKADNFGWRGNVNVQRDAGIYREMDMASQ